MKIIHDSLGFFVVGKTRCADCDRVVKYELSPQLIEFYINNEMYCDRCEPMIKLAKEQGGFAEFVDQPLL